MMLSWIKINNLGRGAAIEISWCKFFKNNIIQEGTSILSGLGSSPFQYCFVVLDNKFDCFFIKYLL